MANYDSGTAYDGVARYDATAVPNYKKKMAKPKMELRRRTDTELASYAGTIVASMTGNASFATPTPTLASVTAKIGEFNAKMSDFAMKSNAARQATVDKETKRVELETILTQLAGYVEAATAGDESAILSAGMQVRSGAAPVGSLPAPVNLGATAGDMEGEVDLAWQPVAGASSYEVDCKLHEDAAVWQRVKACTASRLSVPSLTPGLLYAFRVRAVGAAGEGPWSDEAVRRAP